MMSEPAANFQFKGPIGSLVSFTLWPRQHKTIIMARDRSRLESKEVSMKRLIAAVAAAGND